MKDLESALAQVGAVIKASHIVYTSGRHGECYINKDAIYPHTKLTSNLCLAIAESFANEGIEVVLGPALGGIILSQWVAYHLSTLMKKEVLGIYAEKEPDSSFVIKRGYDQLIAQRKTLIVEDVLTTGGSVKQVVELAKSLGADVRGMGALCNRGNVTEEQVGGVPRLLSLLQIHLQSWAEEECPLCRSRVPINTDVGKGRQFLNRK
jgi:orotate phosphoribosyltransferase